MARGVARDVASEKELYLAPEALPAVDAVVEEQMPRISTATFEMNRWMAHVRHISEEVADTYVAEQITRVTDRVDLLRRARNVAWVYPKDSGFVSKANPKDSGFVSKINVVPKAGTAKE